MNTLPHVHRKVATSGHHQQSEDGSTHVFDGFTEPPVLHICTETRRGLKIGCRWLGNAVRPTPSPPRGPCRNQLELKGSAAISTLHPPPITQRPRPFYSVYTSPIIAASKISSLSQTVACQYPMSNPLDITVEQAREIVLAESNRKGWVRPELRQSQNPETREALEILRRTREALGDTVDMYAYP